MAHPLFAITSSSITGALVAYVAFRLFFREQIHADRDGTMILTNKLLFAVLYGIFTVYSGFVVTPDGATTGMLGPMFVGMMAGSWYGTLTSLFGVALLAVQEFVYHFPGHPGPAQIGHTFYASALAMVAAGSLAGLWHRRLNGQVPSIGRAIAFCCAFEVLVHLPITLAVGWPRDVVWAAARRAVPEVLLCGSMGMAMIVFVTRNLVSEKLGREDQQRIAGELAAARAVQRGLIRTHDPAPFTIPNVDLHAGPVNGDGTGESVFDYHYCADARRLYFGAVDIPGRTTTATLCVLVLKTLFRNKAKRGASLQGLLDDARLELGPAREFLAKLRLFMGVLDVDTGTFSELVALNREALSRNGRGAWHEIIGGPGAAARLEDGDVLVLANQSANAPGSAYLDPALSACFDPSGTMRECMERVATLVRSGRAACGEDGAGMMLIKFQPRADTISLRVDIAEIGRLHEWLTEAAARQSLPSARLPVLDLVLEELVANVIHHGFPEGAGEGERVDVSLARVGDRIAIGIADRGRAFDPTVVFRGPRRKGEVGGWGIQLVKKYVETMEYERVGESNILSLELSLNGS